MRPREFMCTMCPQKPEKGLHVGAGNRTGVLWKKNWESSQPPRHLAIPTCILFNSKGEDESSAAEPRGSGLGPLGQHLLGATHTHTHTHSLLPAIHQRATEARMQNQTGKEEDGACQADPGSRHREGLGGADQRSLEPALGQRKPKAPQSWITETPRTNYGFLAPCPAPSQVPSEWPGDPGPPSEVILAPEFFQPTRMAAPADLPDLLTVRSSKLTFKNQTRAPQN